MATQNNRLYWAMKAVGITNAGSTTYTPIHGVQSMGVTTSFNLEQVFELGQSALYQNIEQTPDVNVTMEKVIDGYPLIYHLATYPSTSASLLGRSTAKSTIDMVVFGETVDSASGTPLTEVTMSGLFVSSLTYTMPVEGNCTESVSLVGNNKLWRSSNFQFTGSIFDNTDSPLSLASGTGGVQTRRNVVFTPTVTSGTDVNGQLDDNACTILPPDIAGIDSNGVNSHNAATGGYNAAIQNITVSADLGRTALNELGHRAPYTRFLNLPVEVKTDIEIISKSGDMISAIDSGIITTGINAGNNLFSRTIKVKLQEGTFINLGTKNKLTNQTTSGGDAGGGNETETYSFVTYNEMTVSHPQDPSGL